MSSTTVIPESYPGSCQLTNGPYRLGHRIPWRSSRQLPVGLWTRIEYDRVKMVSGIKKLLALLSFPVVGQCEIRPGHEMDTIRVSLATGAVSFFGRWPERNPTFSQVVLAAGVVSFASRWLERNPTFSHFWCIFMALSHLRLLQG